MHAPRRPPRQPRAMSTTTDMRHGRQGGNWLPDDYEPISLLTARKCDGCGLPMVVGQWDRHHLCKRNSTVGRRCSCPPGCTDLLVGDAGRCDPQCQPCELHAGRPYDEITEWKRSQTNQARVADNDPADDTPEQLTLEGATP